MKRIAILMTMLITAAGCAAVEHAEKPAGKEKLVWVPGAGDGATDPGQVKHRQERTRRAFEVPATTESVSYLCRHLRHALSGRKIDAADFLKDAPHELRTPYEGHVFASVYGEKAKLFKSAARGKSAAEAALRAIEKLAGDARGKLPAQTETLPVKFDFTELLLPAEMPDTVRRALLPGIDGIWILPVSRGEYRLPVELLSFSPATGTDIALYFSILPKSDALRRFRTRSFLQTRGADTPVELTRSLPPSPEVSAEMLRVRIAAACEYLLRNQRKDGAYAYLYSASRDRYPKAREESMVRHIAAAGIMVLAGEALERQDFIDSAARCIDFVQGRLKREKGIAYLLKKNEGTLGGSGLLAWTLGHYRRVSGRKEYDQIAREAADFILMMRKPGGTFHNYYDRVEKKPIDRPASFYEGEACLGLYWYHKAYGGQKYLDAALGATAALAERSNRAFDEGSPALDAWLMQAARFLYPLAGKDQKETMLRAARKMVEVMVEAQRTEKTASYPDLAGSFRSATQELPSGPGTAAMCEGLAAACQLLDSVGEPSQEAEAALVRAATFQLRHQFWDANTYFLPNPSRARGGIRATLIDNHVRVDHVQHTVGVWLQLLKILE